MPSGKTNSPVDGGPKPFDSAEVFTGSSEDSPSSIAEEKENRQIEKPHHPFARAQTFHSPQAKKKPETCSSQKGGTCNNLPCPSQIKSTGGKQKEKQRPGQTRAELIEKGETRAGTRLPGRKGGWIQAWAGRRGRTRIRLSRAGPSGLTVSTWGSSRKAWWMIRRS